FHQTGTLTARRATDTAGEAATPCGKPTLLPEDRPSHQAAAAFRCQGAATARYTFKIHQLPPPCKAT
ncbi:hypothetical protein D6833_07495, partial [Candidatus Parcubacteria bacterium]